MKKTLSFAQQRLWFLAQLDSNNPVSNISLAYHLTGLLHIAILEQSLCEIAQRHKVLRTTFPTIDGQPVQAIAPEVHLKLSLIDLQKISPIQRETEAQRLIIEEAQQPFDLTQVPLWRVKLLRLSELEHLLLLNLHHIIFDDSSSNIFFQELALLYEALSTGKPLPSELPMQYADFAVWQRQWWQGEKLSHLDYWKQHLGGELPVLELPLDHPRPLVQTYQGAKQSLKLPQNLTEAIKLLGQQEGATLFITVLAAFQTLLYRYTGQEDVIVGSPIANRNRAETAKLIGFCANTLVMRFDLSGNPSFRELLSRVRNVALAAYTHQVPFEKLVEELQPERDLSRSPLFQVMFALPDAPTPALKLANLSVQPLVVDNKTAKFDLFLSMQEGEEGLIGYWEYNTDLFDSATIARMTGHFQTLLEGIVANPEQKISHLPLLTTTELQQLLVEWNPQQPDYPSNICLHQLVERQVEKSPDAVAIIFENEQLTYKELNRRANQLAHYLQTLGVGPEVFVGICMELCLDVAVGILGILKAGGVLVPLEPTYPKERLACILQDTQIPVLLTQERLLNELPQHKGIMVCLDTHWDVIAQASSDNPVSGVKSENLAYILYTSGSTGKPKGVMLSHFVCCNRELWEQRNYPMTETDRILLKSAWSSKELFWPLLAGAKAVMTRQGGYQDSAYLVELLAEQKITVISVVPSVLKILMEEPGIENCTSLRHIFCVGEAMSVDVQESYFNKHLPGKLYNLYGLNEANYATIWQCQSTDCRRFVPIGRPTDMQIYLLNRHLQPVPIGVTGELYISGVGLASGYLNRPELTAERFLDNPFSKVPNAKLYKTGDIARYLPDGNIEYLGRIDHQVNIRGLRIELGEIEAALERHSAVQETVVVAREYGPGDKRLIAYIVPNQEQAPTSEELRRLLQKSLPRHAIPAAFMILKELPRTFNGKINRLALPTLEQVRPELESTFVAPRTEVEQCVANIWSQVLNLEKVGIHDDFFELGGHSLLATQAMSRLREVFQIQLALRDMFEAPTVSDLAKRVEAFCWAVHSISPADEHQDSFLAREEISF